MEKPYMGGLRKFREWMADFDERSILDARTTPTMEDYNLCRNSSDRQALRTKVAGALYDMNVQVGRLEGFEVYFLRAVARLKGSLVFKAKDEGMNYVDMRVSYIETHPDFISMQLNLSSVQARSRMLNRMLKSQEVLQELLRDHA
jgi:hypothetical protein